MTKVKKPDYKKWAKKEGMYWWEFVCLLAEIEPTKSFPEYLRLKSTCKKLKNKEDEMREKGFFEDFNIMDLKHIN